MQVAKKLIFQRLSALYAKEELESITKLIYEKVLGLTRLQVYLNQHETISATNLVQIKEIIRRLAQFEPIQYILGETDFYGLKFIVNQDVLIPRPETEEIVEWIVKDYQNLDPQILDIGTGSGCIPVSLLKNLPEAYAEAWDISQEALEISKMNASLNQVDIGFFYADVLNSVFPEHQKLYDIIVSNPPYVAQSEQSQMLKNVTDYEPGLALFVPDSDPLVFYRLIADIAISRLKPDGNLYFEINERFGNEVVELLTIKGFSNVVLKKDINGKDRMVKAGLKSLQ
ncbi:MAG: peptide chain release factor N(5)-glutamine methyltransferase [Mariniphaga sp.]